MNDLEKHFNGNTGRLINKWQHYFEIYERHFSRFRGKEVNVVEFGVSQGGSLRMWKDYFGPGANIFGVDINPHCSKLEEERVRIFVGDQADRSFLRSLAGQLPRIDILIDDGGHTMEQQINTFEELFPRVDPNGVYLCEDLHTSYMRDWGGGYRKRGTYIEYSKNFIDQINAWHAPRTSGLKINDFTRSAYSLNYYDSVLVIEKRPIKPPTSSKTGTSQIPEYYPRESLFRRIRNRLARETARLFPGKD
ncbi:MAG: hypothetical protein A2081_01145 [Elusimicrobia bacterium GWC2_61_19]|nr:MAG: hypothetical protein A2081_01145 [Elusimicrobia bacterium GWC2_61_19]